MASNVFENRVELQNFRLSHTPKTALSPTYFGKLEVKFNKTNITACISAKRQVSYIRVKLATEYFVRNIARCEG